MSQWKAGTGVTPNIQPRDLGTSRVTAQSNSPPSLHFFSLLIPRPHSGLRSSSPESSPDPSGWTWGPSLRVPPEYRCGALTNCLIDSFILLPSSQCELGCLNSSLQSLPARCPVPGTQWALNKWLLTNSQVHWTLMHFDLKPDST